MTLTKSTQTLTHAFTLVQEAEIRLKSYMGLNDDDPLMTPSNHLVLMRVQMQSGQVDNSNIN